MRFFTTEGPVNCQDHYCLPPLARFDLEDVMALIAQKKYFLLHAPRQTGKTTCLLALATYLNQTGQYHAVYANIEAAQAWRENVEQGMATLITDIATSARFAWATVADAPDATGLVHYHTRVYARASFSPTGASNWRSRSCSAR